MHLDFLGILCFLLGQKLQLLLEYQCHPMLLDHLKLQHYLLLQTTQMIRLPQNFLAVLGFLSVLLVLGLPDHLEFQMHLSDPKNQWHLVNR